jgi:hypothetical protein
MLLVEGFQAEIIEARVMPPVFRGVTEGPFRMNTKGLLCRLSRTGAQPQHRQNG